MPFVKGKSGNPAGAKLHRSTSAELEVRRLAQKHTLPALKTIVEIMGNKDNAPAVRLTAADMVLNRGHGKPIQPHANPDLSPLDWNSMSDEELINAMGRLNIALGERKEDGTLPH